MRSCNSCGAADSPCGTADSPCGTADSSCGAADSPCGTADSPCGAADSSCGAADSPCGAADSSCGTADCVRRSVDSSGMAIVCRVYRGFVRLTGVSGQNAVAGTSEGKFLKVNKISRPEIQSSLAFKVKNSQPKTPQKPTKITANPTFQKPLFCNAGNIVPFWEDVKFLNYGASAVPLHSINKRTAL